MEEEPLENGEQDLQKQLDTLLKRIEKLEVENISNLEMQQKFSDIQLASNIELVRLKDGMFSGFGQARLADSSLFASVNALFKLFNDITSNKLDVIKYNKLVSDDGTEEFKIEESEGVNLGLSTLMMRAASEFGDLLSRAYAHYVRSLNSIPDEKLDYAKLLSELIPNYLSEVDSTLEPFIIQLDIVSSDAKESWNMNFGTDFSCVKGETDASDVTVFVLKEDFDGIFNKSFESVILSPAIGVNLFIASRLKIKGDPGVLIRLADLVIKNKIEKQS